MSDRFYPASISTLLNWIFDELDTRGEIFGMPLGLPELVS
jgi:hypothetical protein